MNTKIWLSPPHMGGSEKKYIDEAFDQNYIAPLGPNVDIFEKLLEQYTGSNHAVALSSGTAAIHLALLLLNVKPDDFVICSSFTFCGSANPIKYINANPVFIDSETETWNMSPELLEQSIVKLIEKNKKPAAIILVHLYGMPAQIDQIWAIADRYKIPIIEDAAEALGSSYKDRMLGTYGDIGILSFNGNKIITTSGGGAILTADKSIADRTKFLSTQARENEVHYEHTTIGYNYRLSNVLAGIGRGQMEVLDEHIKRKREINKIYAKELSSKELVFLTEWSEDCYSNYWLTAVLFADHNKRNTVMYKLMENNIDCRPLWKPMHLQPVFKNEMSYLNGTSEDFFNRGLCLPSGSNLTHEQQEYILGIIKTTLN